MLGTIPEKAEDSDRLSQAREVISRIWHHRSKAFTSGIIEWKCVDDPFGRFETYWVSSSGSVSTLPQGRLQFSSNCVQYSSYSLEYPELGNAKSESRNEREYFRYHLLSHFRDATADRRKPLSYTITIAPDSVVHYWKDDELEGREYPRSVVLPPHALSSFSLLAQACAFASDSQDHDSSVPSPVVHQLSMLPCVLSFRPRLFDTRLGSGLKEVEISFHEYDHEASSLVAIDLNANDPDERSLAWRLLVDPALDYSVRRAIGISSGIAVVQCDATYEQVEGGPWIPSQWTVQVLGRDDPAFVRQIATFRRTIWDKNNKADVFNLNADFEEATWVNDLQTGVQAITTSGDGRWEIPESYQDGHPYVQILALSKGYEIERKALTMNSVQWRRLLVSLTRWPRLILPLSILGGLMFAAIRLFAPAYEKADSMDENKTSRSQEPSGRGEEQ